MTNNTPNKAAENDAIFETLTAEQRSLALTQFGRLIQDKRYFNNGRMADTVKQELLRAAIIVALNS